MYIDFKILLTSDLSLTEFVLLQCMEEKSSKDFKNLLLYIARTNSVEPIKILKNLENKFYIKIIKDSLELEDIVIRQKAIDLFNNDSINYKSIAEKINEIFPPARIGDLNALTKNLKSFTKTYKEYNDPELILSACKLYIREEKENMSGKFISFAHHFVKKENVFKIYSYCKRIKENLKDGNRLNIRL